MKYFIAILVMLLATPAFAEIKLEAPNECVVGELVTLDASESTCEKLKWQVLEVDVALSECVDFKAFGKVACFSARTSSIWLVLISGVAEDGSPEMITHKLVVGGAGGPAAVNLDSKIRSWSKAIDKTEKTKGEAMKLAQSFRAISNADIPADKFLEATAKANKQALGEALQAWVPFLDRLGEYLDSAQLNTTEDYQAIWVEIADGIERAFK